MIKLFLSLSLLIVFLICTGCDKKRTEYIVFSDNEIITTDIPCFLETGKTSGRFVFNTGESQISIMFFADNSDSFSRKREKSINENIMDLGKSAGAGILSQNVVFENWHGVDLSYCHNGVNNSTWIVRNGSYLLVFICTSSSDRESIKELEIIRKKMISQIKFISPQISRASNGKDEIRLAQLPNKAWRLQIPLGSETFIRDNKVYMFYPFGGFELSLPSDDQGEVSQNLIKLRETYHESLEFSSNGKELRKIGNWNIEQYEHIDGEVMFLLYDNKYVLTLYFKPKGAVNKLDMTIVEQIISSLQFDAGLIKEIIK